MTGNGVTEKQSMTFLWKVKLLLAPQSYFTVTAHPEVVVHCEDM